MKVVCIIQARMGSSRLPGKVMMELGGKPMLLNIVDRLSECKEINEIVVATSIFEEDDIIEKLCENNNVNYYRGSLNNVLERFYNVAKISSADIIVRITGDCPLIDSDLVDNVIMKFKSERVDYIAPRSADGLIRGLDVEVFSFSALEKAYKEACTDEEKEHVTLYIYRRPDSFKLLNYDFKSRFKSEGIRLCVDEKRDYDLIKLLYNKFYSEGSLIRVDDVIEYLTKYPEVKKINEDVRQK
ncbi:MAG: glycosyltransferase family protein [Clostridium sp.]